MNPCGDRRVSRARERIASVRLSRRGLVTGKLIRPSLLDLRTMKNSLQSLLPSIPPSRTALQWPQANQLRVKPPPLPDRLRQGRPSHPSGRELPLQVQRAYFQLQTG